MGLSDPDSLSFINNTVLVAPSNHINNTMDSNNNAGYLDNNDLGAGASLATKPWPLLRQSLLMVVILSFAYVVVFFLSIVNNSLVVMVIYRNPQLRTITNIFIANLAVADILVSILVLPITLLGNLFEGRCHHSLFVTLYPWGCSSLGCAHFLEFVNIFSWTQRNWEFRRHRKWSSNRQSQCKTTKQKLYKIWRSLKFCRISAKRAQPWVHCDLSVLGTWMNISRF